MSSDLHQLLLLLLHLHLLLLATVGAVPLALGRHHYPDALEVEPLDGAVVRVAANHFRHLNTDRNPLDQNRSLNSPAISHLVVRTPAVAVQLGRVVGPELGPLGPEARGWRLFFGSALVGVGRAVAVVLVMGRRLRERARRWVQETRRMAKSRSGQVVGQHYVGPNWGESILKKIGIKTTIEQIKT